jgi:two-component system, OmpR family, sensor histidine kinase CreC
MSKRARIFAALILIYALGIGVLLYRFVGDLDPRYREATEDALIDTAHLVASLIEQDTSDGLIRVERLPPAFKSLYERSIQARIYSVEKTRVELRMTVVDAQGAVIFDSLNKSVGQNFSRWRDITRALRGEYGARTTPDVESDPNSAVMFVSVPIRAQGRIVGAVSVGKPVQSFGQYIEASRQKMVSVGIISALATLVFAVFLSLWIVRPFGTISDMQQYWRQSRREGSFSLINAARGLVHSLKNSFNEMRDALMGRSYVADYVQTLTHEVKSPLSAIRGAAELLHEPMPDAQRERFLGNIERETHRIQELVDRMMELTALEARKRLDNPQPVALGALLAELVSDSQSVAIGRKLKITLDADMDLHVLGDTFLLRRAASNLLDNAMDFAPQSSVVALSLKREDKRALLTVQDSGPGIPAYAKDKIFERFYSLARPATQKKSTGLGLAFVQEIMNLHRGKVSLANRSEGGCSAELSFPALAPK